MPDARWKSAYWLGDSWATVLLARAYLTAHGEETEIIYDTAECAHGLMGGWVILTNHGG